MSRPKLDVPVPRVCLSYREEAGAIGKSERFRKIAAALEMDSGLILPEDGVSG